MLVVITIGGRDAAEAADDVGQHLEDLRDSRELSFDWTTDELEVSNAGAVSPPKPACPWNG